jgi:hypothetical protein
MKNIRMNTMEIDGINRADAPDYSDAFVSFAEYEDGTPLTEKEMDEIPFEVVGERIFQILH